MEGLLCVWLMVSCVLSGVWSECNVFELRGCIAPFKTYNKDVMVFFSAFSEQQLDEICRTFGYVNTCVDKVREPCSTEVAEQWLGVELAFEYFCTEGKYTYLTNRECFLNATVQRMAWFCNNTLQSDYKRIESQLRREEHDAIYSNEEDWRKDRCRVMNSFVDCITEVAGLCGAEMSAWQLEMTMLARQPSMGTEGCVLGTTNLKADWFILGVMHLSAVVFLSLCS